MTPVLNERLAVTTTLATLVVALASFASAQQPSFRGGTEIVHVSVSVKRGSNSVVGLGASDFVLSDNGVRQKVSAVSLEALPIDVTLFMDTSGSTAGVLAQMKSNIHEIVAMLGRDDRFRLLTIGHSVYESIPWTRAGVRVDLEDAYPVSNISLVYDALYAAVVHEVAPGRRHLVVALTDGDDLCSVVRPHRLRELVGRMEAVVHWVPLQGQGTGAQGVAVCNNHAPDRDIGAIEDMVKGSGGQKHSGLLGSNTSPVRAFKRILDDYRQSYVLYFTPEGVSRAGWHALKVEVPGGRYTIRARSGYFGRAIETPVP
jgi:VWFA-related protein